MLIRKFRVYKSKWPDLHESPERRWVVLEYTTYGWKFAQRCDTWQTAMSWIGLPQTTPYWREAP